MQKYDICVIGGCGHVGLPLAIAFASEQYRVSVLDINKEVMEKVASGEMPFREDGAEDILKDVIKSGMLTVSSDPSVISESNAVVIVMGTPVESHLNPDLSVIIKALQRYMIYFRDGQLIILRSTLYPGTSEKINLLFADYGLNLDVVFCPERILEGKALKEFYNLPQIVSGFSAKGIERAKDIFSVFQSDILVLSPMEAELAKLFTNTWRYIKFAIANQFYMIASDHNLDYYKIREAMTFNYPRASDLPSAGFAAGPCLFKDTMQLSAFSDNNFFLGHAAMLINEGLPSYIVSDLRRQYVLNDTTVGILGMAFKAESDDKRESLSYKLKNLLQLECKNVLITDPYVDDTRNMLVLDVIDKSDVLIIGANHAVYKDMDFKGKQVIDIWNYITE